MLGSIDPGKKYKDIGSRLPSEVTENYNRSLPHFGVKELWVMTSEKTQVEIKRTEAYQWRRRKNSIFYYAKVVPAMHSGTFK